MFCLRNLVVLLACLLAFDASAQVKRQQRSMYRDVLVYDTDDGLRCMRFGPQESPPQTCIHRQNPETLAFPYSRMLMGALYLQPAPKKVLLIGMGGGVVAMTLQKLLPDAEIDAVELDAAVVSVAREYFNFQPGPKMSVYTEDGRVFVKRAKKQGATYDLIVQDAFDHVYIPEHMITKEYFLELKSILTKDGALAANTFSATKLYDAESATFSSALGPYFNLQHEKPSNRVMIFRNSGLPPTSEVEANARQLETSLKPFGIDTNWLLSLFSREVKWPKGTRLLTDQYSPANLLNGRP